MDIKNKIVELILEGEKVILKSEKKGLYDMPYFDGEEYEKWISKCIYIMEQYFQDSKWCDKFMQASENAVGDGKKYYDTMIGVLKAISESEDIELLYGANKEKNKKLFISHSSKNRNITDEFVELLKGMGVKNDQIYYSSYEETGVNFLQDCFERINQEFNNNELLVIFMISREFYSSKICVAETGATWVRVANNYIPIIIPPYNYNNIEGVISATQSAITLSDVSINTKIEKLKADIEGFLGIEDKVEQVEWNRRKEKFINHVNEIASKLEDIDASLLDITLDNNELENNIMVKLNLINNKKYRIKLDEINISLKIDGEQNEDIYLSDWNVNNLVIQPLEEITVYLSTSIGRKIKRSKIKTKDSKIKVSYYEES